MERSAETSSETLISRIKNRLPLLEYIQRYRPMKPSGSAGGGKSTEFHGSCINPGHEDKNPSFYVNTEKNVFSCRGCGCQGNVVDAYALIHGLSKEVAKFELAKEIGVLHERKATQEGSFLGKMNDRYQWQLARKLDAVDYLAKERGLTEATIKKFGIGYCWGTEFKDPDEATVAHALETGIAKKTDGSKGQVYRSFLAGRITFPIRDRQGNIVAFAGRTYPKLGLPPSDAPKYLNTPEWAQFKKSEMFYGLSESTQGIAKTRTAILVEGYLDVAMLHQTGVTNAIAVMGASASQQAFSQLWGSVDRLIFCLDGDKAGHEGAIRSLNAAAASLVDGKEIRIATLPDNTDPDEYVLEHGREAFDDLCEVQSKTLSQFLLADLARMFPMGTPESRAAFMGAATAAADQFTLAPLLRDQLISRAKGIASVALVDELIGHIKAQSNPNVAKLGSKEELEAAAYLIGKHLAQMRNPEMANEMQVPSQTEQADHSETTSLGQSEMAAELEDVPDAGLRDSAAAVSGAQSLIQRARSAVRSRL
ncbi:MAG: toprim domain-containing protein [Polaromonas sp.]|nr:toprim domain-containing protein [Polaromonas sp.]